nr:ISAs1 family transposase [Roseicella aquatilis]
MCGARSCNAMAEFAASRQADLAEIVPLPHGPLSHDTFSRLFRLLDPAELAKSLTAFLTALRAALDLAPPRSAGVVAIDGKALRRGYEAGQAFLPPLLVSVWDAETRLAIAAARAPVGSEVAATLALLKSLVLKGCTVTADALHCHPAMAEAVLAATRLPSVRIVAVEVAEQAAGHDVDKAQARPICNPSVSTECSQPRLPSVG